MKKVSYLFILMILLSFSTSGWALERFEIITTQELKKMLRDRADGKIDFILVNALDEIIFRHSAIPGSVNLPWIKARDMADRLGPDKEKLIVTY